MGATDSKLAFRKNIFQLYERKDIAVEGEEEFWLSFLELPETPEDVFNFLSQKDIRLIIANAPGNLKTLVQKASKCIIDTSQAVYKPEQSSLTQTLNSIRILTRVLPYVFELEDQGALEAELFWTGNDPMGPQIAKAAVALCFFQGFTIPEFGGEHNVSYRVWAAGLAATNSDGATNDNIARRTEILRFILTLLSKTLYCEPKKLTVFDNKWATLLVNEESHVVQVLLCSLLNVICGYDPSGWGGVPYNHLLFGDVQEPLVTVAIQVLSSLLDYKSWDSSFTNKSFSQSAPVESDNPVTNVFLDTPGDSPENSPNRFVYYTARIHEQADVQLISNGLARLFRNPQDAAKSYLPGATKKISLTTELMSLLWVLLDCNKALHQKIVEQGTALILTEALLGVCLEVRHDIARAGHLRIACFILHLLSQERGYGVSLNEPFDTSYIGALSRHLPIFSQGCWADFVYLSAFVILSTKGPLRPVVLSVQEPLLAILTNTSPLIKSLTVTTGNKLLALFDVFSNPAFLFSKEYNFRMLHHILGFFNNIIQYQYAGNAQLAYSIVRHKPKIDKLYSMTFESATAEVERLYQLSSEKKKSLSVSQSTESIMLLGSESKENLNRNASNSDLIGATTNTSGASVKHAEETPIKVVQAAIIKGKEKTESISAASDSQQTVGFQSKSGFKSTPEWFQKWHNQMPIAAIRTLTEYLGPKIEAFCIENSLSDDRRVVEFLAKATMVGVLPQPHPIVMRRFVYTESVHIWYSSFHWGTVYLKSTETTTPEIAKFCPPIWPGTAVRLFQIKST